MVTESSFTEVTSKTKYLAIIFVLVGLVLIALSVALDTGFWHELLKELGIVLLSVFTVSVIYERLVAEKYLESLKLLLANQLERGESLAAAALKLGIVEIFTSRDDFERKYPLSNWLGQLQKDESIRIVAKSLFLLMNKPEAIKNAVARGVSLEFCLVTPSLNAKLLASTPDLELSDIQSALAVFDKQIHSWIVKEHPKGSVEIRFHQLPSIDSYLVLGPSNKPNQSVWDLSFGRDVTSKRIFRVDPSKPFGKDLASRYETIWSGAKKAYHYNGKEVLTNNIARSRLTGRSS